jgi:membrane associated rhomboid family serine protease
MNNITPVVKQLLIINIIFFIGSQLVPIADNYFALYYFENPMFKFWQPLTHMFMHGGIPHIFFNMFALFSFGSALEHFWGGKKFLFFYISCGLGAALLHSVVNYYQFHSALNILVENGINKTEVFNILAQGKYNLQWEQILGQSELSNLVQSYNVRAVGASGAIYGLLVAFAFMVPNAELSLMFIPIPIKAKYFVPGILAIDLFLGFKGSSIFGAGSTGIAHFAHIGGALTGFIMMWFWKKNQFNHNRWN